MKPYKALATAIVELAVKDYKKALKQHYHFPADADYANEVKSLEKFFRSDWYEALTDLDSEYLMSGVRRIVCTEVTT